MPILTVESVVLTKSGKAYSVKAGGKYYVASKKTGIEQIMPGTMIDATVGSFATPSGDTVATIDGFTKPNGNAPKTAQNGSGGVQVTDRFYMAFVSNVVAHAIQSGHIDDPDQIAAWAIGARDAALALEEKPEAPKAKIDDVEDDIPF